MFDAPNFILETFHNPQSRITNKCYRNFLHLLSNENLSVTYVYLYHLYTFGKTCIDDIYIIFQIISTFYNKEIKCISSLWH